MVQKPACAKAPRKLPRPKNSGPIESLWQTLILGCYPTTVTADCPLQTDQVIYCELPSPRLLFPAHRLGSLQKHSFKMALAILHQIALPDETVGAASERTQGEFRVIIGRNHQNLGVR